jgi:hypothetical protein
MDPLLAEFNETRTTYYFILRELKLRMLAISHALDNVYNLPRGLAHEFATLQLRMVCELVALGILAAHGDIAATRNKNLREEYHPSTIFKKLSDLHPDFFPVSFARLVTSNGDLLGYKPKPTISKNDIISLHGRTGDILHRGGLSEIANLRQPDFQTIRDWNDRFRDLLCYHMVVLSNPEHRLFCIMHDERHDVGLWLTRYTPLRDPKPDHEDIFVFDPTINPG